MKATVFLQNAIPQDRGKLLYSITFTGLTSTEVETARRALVSGLGFTLGITTFAAGNVSHIEARPGGGK